MFYGQHNLDEIIYNRFFKDKSDSGFFVECGAFDGFRDSTCKFFEESLNWKGLNIEPVPYIFEKLLENRPNSINENVALSSECRTEKFTQAIHPEMGRVFGNGSIQHSENHFWDLKITQGCTFENFMVQCVKFSSLVEKHQIKSIDLFVLDVEGYELPALQGTMEIEDEVLPKVFCIETGITSKEDILKALKGKYNYHSDFSNNSFFVKK